MPLEVVCGSVLDHPCFAHQCNCLTTSAHGLSAAVADRFPWADVYAERQSVGRRNLAAPADRPEPGTVAMRARGQQTVVAMFAQYDYGRPGAARAGRPAQHRDTRENRLAWFVEALGRLGGLESVAFPERVGCGLAGGDWRAYRAAIARYAAAHPATRVSIVRLSSAPQAPPPRPSPAPASPGAPARAPPG